MKQLIILLIFLLSISSCKKSKEIKSIENPNRIIGTWQLVYGEIKEGDSVQIKDLSKTIFIKIINKDHFAFFNQIENEEEGFYSGGGTYSLKGKDYTEKLKYISLSSLREEEFHFTVEFKGDTLIQSGLEDVKEANIKRYIIEKYIKVD